MQNHKNVEPLKTVVAITLQFLIQEKVNELRIKQNQVKKELRDKNQRRKTKKRPN